MLFTLPALVLDKDKIKEIDFLVTLLTPRGKIKALAKGAQKSFKRFLNLLEDLTYLRVHLRKPQRGRTLILEGADLLYLPESPRKQLLHFYFFSYLSEVIDFTAPISLSKESFFWITDYIKELDKRGIQGEHKFLWEMRWLEICGLSPYLSGCVRCGSRPQRLFYFSLSQGGVLCLKCRDEQVFTLTQAQIDLLRKIGRIKKLADLDVPLQGLSVEEKRRLLEVSERFFIYHFDWEPRSLKLLKELWLGHG